MTNFHNSIHSFGIVENVWFFYVGGIRQRSRQLCPSKISLLGSWWHCHQLFKVHNFWAAGLVWGCPGSIFINQLISFYKHHSHRTKTFWIPSNSGMWARRKFHTARISEQSFQTLGSGKDRRNWEDLSLALWCTWWGADAIRGNMGTNTRVWTAENKSKPFPARSGSPLVPKVNFQGTLRADFISNQFKTDG